MAVDDGDVSVHVHVDDGNDVDAVAGVDVVVVAE